MVIPPGMFVSDPGVIVNWSGCVLCQEADTAGEKVPARETP